MRKIYLYLALSSAFLLLGCDGLKKFLIQKLGSTDKYEIEGDAADWSVHGVIPALRAEPLSVWPSAPTAPR